MSASDIAIFDFDGTYLRQHFLTASGMRRADCTALSGVCRFCDADGARLLRQHARRFGPAGLHWLGSGHYHYLTLFFLEQIEEPFALVLADRHTDMQPAPDAGLLSCGSWLYDALQTCDMLQMAVVLGVDAKLAAEAPAVRRPVCFFPASDDAPADTDGALHALPPDLPVYFSIDKDVLLPDCAVTDWGNGVLPMDGLCRFIAGAGASRRVIGADVCGDTSEVQEILRGEAAQVNNASSRRIFEALHTAVSTGGQP